MAEFTLRAVLIGLVMTVILGAANAYLGLKAGMTIAATYPAAVIGMAVLRLFKGSILEENIARTVGSIGESVAAGAIFTIPAFVLSGAWSDFSWGQAWWKSSALMAVGGLLGIFFVTLLRRVMVEDPELPYPESVAASEIHKAGQRGGEAAAHLFRAMGVGAAVYGLGVMQLFAASKDFIIKVGSLGKSIVRLGSTTGAPTLSAGGITTFSAPKISPAYLGVGYIIGPSLAALNFAGSLLAWGLLVPLLIFFLGPELQQKLAPAGHELPWDSLVLAVWRFIVRPIAVGGMMVGAAFTLFRMRQSVATGLRRALADLKKSASQKAATNRTEQDLDSKIVFPGLAGTLAVMAALYFYFAGSLSGALAATLVMAVIGFFFAAVSGNLVGLIGSSNNPVSGLTLSTLIIAALLMVSVGVTGMSGVAAVLGVAAVVCVSSAVAGEMLQDLKVGYILGGTPYRMQIGDIFGVIVASAALYWPLFILHAGNIKSGGIGFGDRQLSAPQAGLMAMLAQGIVGGEMPWPLVVAGMLMGLSLILIKVRSPMLFAVGMYLPLETTFAIWVGGLFRWLTDTLRDKRSLNDAQKARVENVGILVASGLIAGEALVGLAEGWFRYREWKIRAIFHIPSPSQVPLAAFALGVATLAFLAWYMIATPLRNAGSPDEPAPPTAIM
ncbi:MAG: oligopeptide transporter, OPT family [Acidobacteria bacterium]|nr:oligopeptide transporter, OPT family [Acidobacteriota bacterium]